MINDDSPIVDLDLTCGSYNALRRIGIETVGELVGRTADELMNLIPRPMSPYKRVDEIKVVLQRHGRSLAT